MADFLHQLGLPVVEVVASASRHEAALLRSTLAAAPGCLVGRDPVRHVPVFDRRHLDGWLRDVYSRVLAGVDAVG